MAFGRRYFPRIFRLTLAVLFTLSAAAVLLDRVCFPLPQGKLHRAHAQFVYSREGELLAAFASSDFFWRKPASLGEISPQLVATLLAVEDRWFEYHPGVNPIALLSATWDNARAGRIVRGGSTITMQIARMIEPKERTIGGKLIEILRAVQLEAHYSKDELLTIYFNLVPYGGNIEGVGAATHFYFEKTPALLTWSEAAILAAIPASPNAYRPDLHPEACRSRRDRVLNILRESGLLTQPEYEQALAEEIPTGRIERPFVAPHFCQMVTGASPTEPVLLTTLDFNLQRLCERLAERYHGALEPLGIHNLALVVLDNTSGEIRAMVGSPDFTNRAHAGQINGALARRSPGSALKPFAYALAFDEGLISPQARLDDIPVSYSGYAPENYDEQYHGVVSVTDALVNSFNVPAVNLTYQVGLKKFHRLLNDGGLGLTRKYFDYGLPLVLGACEVTLLDLSALYASLARGGDYLPPRALVHSTKPTAKRLLSPASAYLTTDILANLQRTDFPASWEFTRDRPAVAWKTGTSYGRKDAWSVGYNPEFTVGVWTGNFSGESSPYLVGAETATPLMLEIFDGLMRGREPVWFARPSTVQIREVCGGSGMLPSGDCPATVRELYIESVSPAQHCALHSRLLVDRMTGHALCRACADGREADTLIIERWPARLTGWLRDRNLAGASPGHNPECTGVIRSDAPVISSPEPDQIFELRSGAPAEFQKIPFRASVGQASGRVHWFLDEKLFAVTQPGVSIFYAPERGRHILMAVDDFGYSSTLTFTVQ